MFYNPLVAVVVALLVVGAIADRAVGQDRAIRRSDVVFMYDNPERYEDYGCTVLGWAGRADKQHIRRAHEMGVRHFSCSVGFLTEFGQVIDFSDDFLDAAARNFAGEPFIVPWLWDHKHQGQPAWWWCTNSPLYQQYLVSRLEDRMAAEPDGLHIDDYRGSSGSVTWLSGCFCRHCIKAFRDYVAEHVQPEKLTELGIDDVQEFDYRTFLTARGVTPEAYNAGRARFPLADEFYDFHVKSNNAFVAEYRRRAERVCGKSLTLCVNSSLASPDSLVITPHLSYFCCEVRHEAAKLAPATHPIYIYKLADALRRPVTSTASGQDWAYVNEHNKTCMVRSWAALSYAFGHTLMAPHRQWCYDKEKGTHWYSGPTEQYAWLYQFVRQHARLLDGYEAVARVAVVYDNAARRRHRGDIEEICVALAERNVPFGVVIAGDDWLENRLDAQVNMYDAVIIPQELAMDQPQQKVIDAVEKAGRLVRWPDDERLDKLVGKPIRIEGTEDVMVVARAVPSSSEAPPVVHLLNRRYNPDTDALIARENFTLRLDAKLFQQAGFRKATLHAPRSPAVNLEVTSAAEGMRVTIPKLDLWAILELQR